MLRRLPGFRFVLAPALLALLLPIPEARAADTVKEVGLSVLVVDAQGDGGHDYLPLVNLSVGRRFDRFGFGLAVHSLGLYNELTPQLKAYNLFGAERTRVNLAAGAGLYLGWDSGFLYGGGAEIERGRYVLKAGTDYLVDSELLTGRVGLGARI